MEGIVRAATEQPLAAMAVCFAVLLIVYFLFKSLIKLALILMIVAVAIGGYLYFQHPESRPANLKDAVEKARTGAGKAMNQGKEAYKKGRELLDKEKEAYKKGKEWVDKGKTVLDKGIDKGKEWVDKGKTVLDKGIDKGKEWVDKGKIVLDKGIDKGKDAVEKGKNIAGDNGKLLGGDKKTNGRH